MSEPIKPALTAEEWEGVPETRWTVNGRNFWFISSDQDRSRGDYRLSVGAEREETGWAAHGLPDEKQQKVAALALYRQPFGFTREDVKILNDAIGNVYQIQGEWGAGSINEKTDPELMALRSLADRIEALLPPAH